MKRTEIFSFRLNISEKEILEKKKKELKSSDSLGTIAKKLALTRNLPKNDNDIEFLSLLDFVFESLKQLGGKLNDEAFNELKCTYQEIENQYEAILNKIL